MPPPPSVLLLTSQLLRPSSPAIQDLQDRSYLLCVAAGDGSCSISSLARKKEDANNETSCISSTTTMSRMTTNPPLPQHHLRRNSEVVEEEAVKHSCFSSQQSQQQKRKRASAEILTYQAPACLSIGTERYLSTLSTATISNGCDTECPICMTECSFVDVGSCSASAVTLVKCGHIYHRECIHEAFKRSPRCPKCRADIIEPQGRCPSGKMIISQVLQPSSCAGYEDVGCYQIDYHIANGVQQEYHDHPGVRFKGTRRRAYLPNNKDGSDLLNRLKYAWMHGLTFSVGTSMTTGVSNVVIWSSIHHKTARSGGTHMHGFPDPNFLYNCNQELDALGVPA
jgi:deltex-like protein